MKYWTEGMRAVAVEGDLCKSGLKISNANHDG